MMLKKAILLISLLVFLAASAIIGSASEESRQLSPEELQVLLDKVECNFSGIQTLKTRLAQEKSIPVFSEVIPSKGFCLFKRPDRLRLEYTEPFKSVLMVDGTTVSKYEYFNDAWQKLSPGGQDILLMITGNISSWLQGRFRDAQLYDISAVQNETVTVRLVPKSEDFRRFVASFELGLNSGLDGLTYIVIHEKQDAFTRIRFFDDVINGDLPETAFSGSAETPAPIPVW